MSSRSIAMSEALQAYLLQRGVREAPVLRRLREETATMPMAMMQISPEQGAFMALLVELMAVERYLEVGVFTGYSALWVALALPENGRLTALDISEEWTRIARRYWTEVGVAEKIDLRLGDAVEGMDRLLAEGHWGSYDLAFIDAEKTDYEAYYERAIELVRPGGLIAIDNALQSGRVTDPERHSEAVQAVARLNVRIQGDERVSMVLLPIGDGLMLCRKRR